MAINKAKVDRVKKFIGNLSFTKGEWAGRSFHLVPWQMKLIEDTFGTVREDGFRQYRIVYVEIPKKNGKSELAAAIGLYMLAADGEGAPEVYTAAADRDQASLIYHAAASMVRNNAILSKTLRVLDSRKRIYNLRNNGFYQVLSSDVKTKHGLSPSCVLFDELHAQPNDELWNVLTAGTDYARKQQLILVLTTAGVYDKNSVWWRVREKARQIRDGIVAQDNFLPVLFIADPEKDNADDEEVWKRVNPSLGQIFTLDKIRQDYNEAKQNPIDYQNFLRFRLNIPIKQLSRWMPMDKWDACAGEVDLEKLKGRRCFGGIDLSQTVDLSAFSLVFPPESDGDKFIISCRFYCPEENIRERSRTDRVHYDIWRQQGHIMATPGDVVDLDYIRRDVLWAKEEFNLQEIAYDKKFASHFAIDLLNNHDVSMVETPQLAKHFNEPMNNLLKTVMSGGVIYDGNPVLRWNFDNMVIRPYVDGSIQPDKAKATDRIDGAVATFMAWGRAMFAEATESVYETRGVVSF